MTLLWESDEDVAAKGIFQKIAMAIVDPPVEYEAAL